MSLTGVVHKALDVLRELEGGQVGGGQNIPAIASAADEGDVLIFLLQFCRDGCCRVGAGKDLAIEWLNKGYQERNPLMAYAKVMPSYDSLRSDPRFSALLTRLGLGN